MFSFMANTLGHFYKNFQGFTYCSVFKVLCCRFRDSLFTITQLYSLVNNFFQLFSKFFLRSQSNAEGGIWTLAPVSRPTPLAGAPLRPLEYFSPTAVYYDFFAFWRSRQTQVLLYKTVFNLSTTFFTYFFSFFCLLDILFPFYFQLLYLDISYYI